MYGALSVLKLAKDNKEAARKYKKLAEKQPVCDDLMLRRLNTNAGRHFYFISKYCNSAKNFVPFLLLWK